MPNIIVHRKKIRAIITVVIAAPALLLFFLAGGYALLSERDMIEKIVFLFFFILSSFGLYALARAFKHKILSDDPEFELTDKTLRVYGNPYYHEIPFADVIDCGIYHAPKGVTLLGIRLRNNSSLASNSNMLQVAYFGLRKKEGKMVFLSMECADINPEVLAEAIKAKTNVAATEAPA